MDMRRQLPALVLATMILAGACGDGGAADPDGGDQVASDTVTAVPATPPPNEGTDSTTPDESAAPPSLTATPLTPATSAPPDPSLSPVPPEVAAGPEIQAAVADLAGRLGVDPAEVDVLEVREVTWADGSLGCPEPGVSYIQQLVNGQLVVLSAGGRRHEYHSGPGRPLFYCADPRPPAVAGSGAGDD